MKKLGLVGGISWVSTIEYYKLINEGVNKRLGGLHFAECMIYSIDFGHLQEIGWNEACPLLLDACLKLEACGAEGIVLCANTAHLHMKAIQKDFYTCYRYNSEYFSSDRRTRGKEGRVARYKVCHGK